MRTPCLYANPARCHDGSKRHERRRVLNSRTRLRFMGMITNALEFLEPVQEQHRFVRPIRLIVPKFTLRTSKLFCDSLMGMIEGAVNVLVLCLGARGS